MAFPMGMKKNLLSNDAMRNQEIVIALSRNT